METRPEKKHPCPDCHMCQWCSDARCELCGGWRKTSATDKCCGKCGLQRKAPNTIRDMKK